MRPMRARTVKVQAAGADDNAVRIECGSMRGRRIVRVELYFGGQALLVHEHGYPQGLHGLPVGLAGHGSSVDWGHSAGF